MQVEENVKLTKDDIQCIYLLVMSISSILYLLTHILSILSGYYLITHIVIFNLLGNGIRKNARIVIKSVPCVNNYVGRYQVQTVNKDV